MTCRLALFAVASSCSGPAFEVESSPSVSDSSLSPESPAEEGGASGNAPPSTGPMEAMDAGTEDPAPASGGTGGAGGSSSAGSSNSPAPSGAGGDEAAAGGTGGSGDTGGTAGTGGAPSPSGELEKVVIVTNERGWIDPAENSAGIEGVWYSFTDCNASPEDCTRDFERQMPWCARGETAEVKHVDEYKKKFGATLAFDLAGKENAAGVYQKNPFNALSAGVEGFELRIRWRDDHEAPVRFALAQGAATYLTLLRTGEEEPNDMISDYRILWSDLAQPDWEVDRKDFDPTAVESVRFTVPTKLDEKFKFDFCVEEIAALVRR